MTRLTDEEQGRILADLLTGNGLPPNTTNDDLDPAMYGAGEARLAILACKAGLDPRTEIAPMLSPAFLSRLLRRRPDETPNVLYPGSSWSDLGELLGPITFAWWPWLPNGFLSMLLADQEMGKSLLLLRIAACYLLGWPWPDGAPFAGLGGDLLWCEAESSQGLNYARAKAWGLPLDRIKSPLADPLDDVMLDNPDHMQAIENWARRPQTAFVAVDSLTGASMRDMNDARMFHIVKCLADLARDTGKPVQLSHHIRKLTLLDERGIVTLQQGRGSGAIFQPARCVWAIDTPDPNDEDTRRLALIKNNLVGKRAAAPLGFTIGSNGLTFCDAPMKPHQETQADRAGDLLRTLLRKEPMRSTEVQEEIESAGLSWDAAKRAKRSLGIVATRRDGVWWWGLPAIEPTQTGLYDD